SLPAFLGRQRSAADATCVHESCPGNVALTVSGVRGDADAIFREAPYVRRETFKVHRHTALPMETRGLFAEWDRNGGTLRVSGLMKVPFAVRALTAKLLGMPEDQVEGVETDVGGGFGMRGEFYPEDFWVPYAAKTLRCAVKWIEDRREHLTAITHAREAECDLEIACTRDGEILALRGTAWFDIGAYIRPNGMTSPRNLAQMIPGPYRIRHLQMDVHLLLSNKTPSGSYRGPGRFEADFFRERLMDMAAQDLGIDRVEFRRRNLLTEADMPFHLGKVLPYDRDGGTTDTGDYRITLDRALQEIGWEDKKALQGRLIDGKYHGLGIGCYLEGGSAGPAENARLVLRPDGNVEVYVGSSGVGQGIETAFGQIAADALQVNINRITGVFHGSTTYVKLGYGTSGSRSTVMGGSALLDAGENLKQAIRKRAADQFGCDPQDVQITDEMRTVTAQGKFRTIAELASEKIEAEGTFRNDRRTYSYGAHAAHVAVDPGTGGVEVLEYVSVEDVGRIINPGTLHGQVLGAIVQGLGASLLEHLVYDEHGQLLTGSLANYLVPAAGDFPNIKAIALEMYPSPISPLGAKGAGEGGIIPVGGVIANAVASALSGMSVRTNELPLSPDRVWTLMSDAGANPGRPAG
ncbi:MAG TPA: molybdopterin cofactor-binding domain-containing protein, partial [Burkholderiales bacterium]|nr:molybdopterin cofactor-binding domain-containing protein [Burkholderiales bacterium]